MSCTYFTGNYCHREKYRKSEEIVQKHLTNLTRAFQIICNADEQEITRLNRIIAGEITDDCGYGSRENNPSSNIGSNYVYKSAAKDGEDMWLMHYEYRESLLLCWDLFGELAKISSTAAAFLSRSDRSTCLVLAASFNMLSQERTAFWKEAQLVIGNNATGVHSPDSAPESAEFVQADQDPPLNADMPATDDINETLPDSPAKNAIIKNVSLPVLPVCSSIIREGLLRYCPADEAKKAIISATSMTSLGSKGVAWINAKAVLSSDGIIHFLSSTGDSKHPQGDFITKSIPLKVLQFIALSCLQINNDLHNTGL